MKASIRPATLKDMQAVDIQPIQEADAARLRDPHLQRLLEAEGEAWAMEFEDSTLAGVAGVTRCGPHRAHGWALVGKSLVGNRRGWVDAARAIGARLTILQEYEGFSRIEAETPMHFVPGHMLLHHLGFRWEGPMPFAGANGETYVRYGRYGARVPDLPTRYVVSAGLARDMLWKDAISRTSSSRRAA